MNAVVSWHDVKTALAPHDKPGVLVFGIPPNGAILASLLLKAIAVQEPDNCSIILDDYIDVGEVREYYQLKYKKIFIALFDRPVLMPWNCTTQGLRK